MNPFKTFTMKWWQGSLFKVGMLAAGVAVGAYWPEFFSVYLLPLVAIAVVSLAYVSYIWWKQ
jgi:hypothetical protein